MRKQLCVQATIDSAQFLQIIKSTRFIKPEEPSPPGLLFKACKAILYCKVFLSWLGPRPDLRTKL
jgi:hypothetical protein